MKRNIWIILVVLVVELLNFSGGAAVALDPGANSTTPWYIKMIGYQWGILHAPGIYLIDSLERGTSLPKPGTLGTVDSSSPDSFGNHISSHQNVSRAPSHPPLLLLPHWTEIAVLFLSGFFSTTLLVLLISFFASRFLQWKRKHGKDTGFLAAH